MIKLWIKTVIYLFIGFVLFVEFTEFVHFPEKIDKSTVTVRIEQIGKTFEKLEQERKKYLIAYINGKNSRKVDTSEEKRIEWYRSLKLYQYIFENNFFIALLYVVILLSFLMQMVMLAWSKYYTMLMNYIDEKRLDAIFLYSSQWAVNVPPVLGVVGTIFSFGIVVTGMQDASSLSTLFKNNFANAALTTILGGSVYVVNLFVNIFIAKNLVGIKEVEI